MTEIKTKAFFLLNLMMEVIIEQYENRASILPFLSGIIRSPNPINHHFRFSFLRLRT